MDSKQDSLERYNSLTTSEQIALCAYWFDLRKEPGQEILSVINSFQEKACVFDVPEVIVRNK